MILDHIAYRVTNRKKAAGFLAKTLKYTTNTEFEIVFDNKSTAECLVLEPNSSQNPEIFISDGTDNSVVGEWVQAQNGSGGIHHIAYRVSDIYAIVQEWKENGVQFLTEDVIDCPEDNMKQIFSKPLDILGGLIIELIERQDKGFCQNSVKDLMNSTKGIK
jgi:4-hydroxyphenylpyruvate dioxygenase-like putative hemolysin|tara:strand:+ start:1522 stop:2004 length:483 start_codon:yes stop_codon:yes gene_type:complete